MACSAESPGRPTWTQETPSATSADRPSRCASASNASDDGSPPAGFEKEMSTDAGLFVREVVVHPRDATRGFRTLTYL